MGIHRFQAHTLLLVATTSTLLSDIGYSSCSNNTTYLVRDFKVKIEGPLKLKKLEGHGSLLFLAYKGSI